MGNVDEELHIIKQAVWGILLKMWNKISQTQAELSRNSIPSLHLPFLEGV